MRLTLKVCCLTGLLFAPTAAAQEAAQETAPGTAQAVAQEVAPEMKSPRVLSADVDWGAVRAALADFAPLTSHG